MTDIGITAQRYSLVLYGNSQKLKIESWEPEIVRSVAVPFEWKADTWYHLKLRVENMPDGKVQARGKAWPVGQPEPDAWTIEKIDASGNHKGAPGFFVDAEFGAYLDNLKLTANQMRKLVVVCSMAVVGAATLGPCDWRWQTFGLKAEAAGLAAAAAGLASDPGSGDWPMWGGTPDRNMVSNMKGLPTEWDVKTKKNVKWVADLGSQSYGNPVVAGGMVFVGTNNEGASRSKNQAGDRGVLMAFRESNGEFLWQQTHEKLSSGRANDWPFQGVASSPLVEGTKLYYTSNRGVVWCLDINGFRDGKNDGPVTDEKLTGEHDADVDLVVRHDGGGRLLPTQHVELVAGHLGRPHVREHVERTGRKPRPHSISQGARDHRPQQEHRQAGVGGQLGRGSDSPRSMVHAGGRQSRRRRSGRERPGRRLGTRLRSADGQEAVGVRHQSEGFRVAQDPQRGDLRPR